jgi:hypothetical protein
MDFREFNELQHNFERRMGPSYEAEGYLSLFGKTEIVTAAKNPLFYCGSLGGSLGLCHD